MSHLYPLAKCLGFSMSHNLTLARSWHLLHLCLHPLRLTVFPPISFSFFKSASISLWFLHLSFLSFSLLPCLFPSSVHLSVHSPLNMYFLFALYISGSSFPQPHSLSSLPPSLFTVCASLFLLQPLLLWSPTCIPRWKDIMVPTGLKKAQVGVGSCPSLSLISAISPLGGSRWPEGAGLHPHAVSHVLST